jgi:DNA repair protein RadC
MLIKEVKLTTEKTGNKIPNFGKITSSTKAAEYCREFWHEDINIYESFFILLLNRQAKPIAWAKISQGGVTGTIVDPRIVAKYAIETLASGVICAHNHPSGALQPSDADISVTKKIKEGLKLFDIELLDHVILTEEGHYSFADHEQI